MAVPRQIVPWIKLLGISLLLSASFVAFLTFAMLSRSGSHSYWCPRAPEGFPVSCIPSLPAVIAGTWMVLVYAVPPFIVGGLALGIMQWIAARRGRRTEP